MVRAPRRLTDEPKVFHRWKALGDRRVRLHVLQRAHFPGESDTLLDAGDAIAYVAECTLCLTVAAYVHREVQGGHESFSAYGVDFDSLGIARHAPRCESLQMPQPQESETQPQT